MLVKDQLRIRMEQLDMSIGELAARVEVSNQTVRHWLSGRNFPTKSKTPALEKALSCKIDYSEGQAPLDTIEGAMQKEDVEMFLLISQLPPEVRHLFARWIKAFTQYNTSASHGTEGPLRLRSATGGGRRHSVSRPPAR